MSNPTKSEGAILLGKLGLSQKQVSDAVEVSRPCVSYWLSGKNKPNPAQREALFESFGVPEESWDVYPSIVPSVDSTQPNLVAVETTKTSETETTLRASLARLLAMRDDPSFSQLPPQEQRRHEEQVKSTALALARVTGEGRDNNVLKIKRSSAWRAIEAAFEKALAPYPEALHALTLALQEVEE